MNTLLIMILPLIFCFLTDSAGNFHTERTGDAICQVERQVFTTKTVKSDQSSSTSSAASNVQPADAACPQSAASPAALSEPKISVAEVYSRLVEEHKVPWSEPTPLPGNTQEDRLLW